MMRLVACAEDPHKYRRKSFLFGRVWDGCEHSSTAFRCGMFRIQIRRERKTEDMTKYSINLHRQTLDT
jgi:hypothetical protein